MGQATQQQNNDLRSRLSRFANAQSNGSNGNGANTTANNNQQVAQTNQNNANANNQNTNGSSSRFGRQNPFVQNQQLQWCLTPIQRTVVRFQLGGLGDPFYRLLGHDLNTEYADVRKVTHALEAGGEHVDTLKAMLDDNWERCNLTGAMLIYTWNANQWKNLLTPVPLPISGDADYQDDQSEEGNEKQQPEPKPMFKVLHAMDMVLTLNILARARSQLLLVKAPLVMSQEYLSRAIVTDDPRLVALAQATGCLEETLA